MEKLQVFYNSPAPVAVQPRIKSQRKVSMQDSKRISSTAQFSAQNAYLAHELTHHVLSEEGLKLNGRNGDSNGHSTIPSLSDARFKASVMTLKRSCADLRTNHRGEIVDLAKSLDISDAQLYSSYRAVALRVVEDGIHRGRLISLFTFTGMLAARLYLEGQQDKIDGLTGWLAMFLNQNVSKWLKEHGGWVSKCFYCVS